MGARKSRHWLGGTQALGSTLLGCAHTELLGAAGILNVHAEDKTTGRSNKITITNEKAGPGQGRPRELHPTQALGAP